MNLSDINLLRGVELQYILLSNMYITWKKPSSFMYPHLVCTFTGHVRLCCKKKQNSFKYFNVSNIIQKISRQGFINLAQDFFTVTQCYVDDICAEQMRSLI